MAISAARFRFDNKNYGLSYIDCVGYLLSKEMGVKFLTSDGKFRNKENVEFIESLS